MTQWAAANEEAEQVFLLCRLLFEAKEGGQFRRPMLGGPVFLGGTTSADWPLEPIAVLDGVPFLVVRSYQLAGRPEAASNYVKYCLANCRWPKRGYVNHTPQQLRAVLDKLLKSNVWKTPLTDSEIEFLTQQISANWEHPQKIAQRIVTKSL